MYALGYPDQLTNGAVGVEGRQFIVKLHVAIIDAYYDLYVRLSAKIMCVWYAYKIKSELCTKKVGVNIARFSQCLLPCHDVLAKLSIDIMNGCLAYLALLAIAIIRSVSYSIKGRTIQTYHNYQPRKSYFVLRSEQSPRDQCVRWACGISLAAYSGY